MNKFNTGVKMVHLVTAVKKHNLAMFSTIALFAIVFACLTGCGVTITDSGTSSSGSSTSDNSSAGGNPTNALMAAFQQAHEQKDVDGLMALYCWDGVPADLRETIRGNVQDYLLQPISDIKFEPIDPDQFGETVSGGRRWRKNLPPIGKMVVSFTKQGAFGWTDIEQLIGQKGGRCLIVVSVPAS